MVWLIRAWLLSGTLLAVTPVQAAEHPQETLFSDWAGSAFLNEPLQQPPTGPGLHLRRQDHGQLELQQSVMHTPLRIGTETFEHGLGSHSVSDILVHLPKPASMFDVSVGLDNNGPNGSGLGSVVFLMEIGERRAFRSPVMRGGEPPRPIHIKLDGAQQFRLRILDGGDGPSYDHGDWAGAKVTYTDGSQQWLDELPLRVRTAEFSGQPPFSFKYAGKTSSELFRIWKQESSEIVGAGAGRRRHLIIYSDNATGLQIKCELTRFTDAPAFEWVLYFQNVGGSDTPIIEQIRPLDFSVQLPPTGSVTLHGGQGSTASATDFLPVRTVLDPGVKELWTPNGGRSSDGRLPFFNVEWTGGGVLGAIGWSGQWSLQTQRTDATLRIDAGQQTSRFILHPGEVVRTPRVLLVGWEGNDRLRGHNLLRRVLMEHYVPRLKGEPILPFVSQNTWFVYNQGNGVTEQNQLAEIERMAKLGVETYWLDAGWFEGGWPAGAGSWVPRKDAFPNGLKPLGDAAHARGMKFLVWFEPERVNPASRIAQEHPEWVLHAPKMGDGLFNLGIPEAREWLTGWLSKCITDWGIDIYRNDFNIPPLPFWQAADSPDRQGITEIRYIEGLYAMWDELAKCRGGIALDNCASGGRRIDLETISRAFVLTRSDSVGVAKPMPVQEQTQTMGLSLWFPLHATLGFGFEPYDWLSTATGGCGISQDTKQDSSAELARRMIGETKRLREFWTGEFYPLTEIDQDEKGWAAWQLHRADLGKGCVLAFRRAKSLYAALECRLQGLDPKATYEVSYLDRPQKLSLTGEQLSRLRVDVDRVPGSEVIDYEKK